MNIINIFDKSIIEFAHKLHTHYNILDIFFSFITRFGEAAPLIIFTVILIFIKKTRLCAVNIAVNLFICFILVNIILKPLIGRERPFTENIYYEYWVNAGRHLETSFSCPSSHTVMSFAVLFTIFLYFNKKYSFTALIIAFLIGFSRIYLIVHYPSDVILGIFIGIFISYAVYLIMNKINNNFSKLHN